MDYNIQPLPSNPLRVAPHVPRARVEGPRAEAGGARLYLNVFFGHLWLIAGIVATVTALGLMYALFATPIYKATILFQVEDTDSLPAKVSPSDSPRSFDIKTASAPEQEVLRSRMVLAAAVDNTRSYIDVRPMYFPLIGAWIARNQWDKHIPEFLKGGGYVWGNERVQVDLFNVPPELERVRFEISVHENGRYSIAEGDRGILIQGRAGQMLKTQTAFGPVEIQVAEVRARPGSKFELVRQPRIAAIEELQREIQIGEKGRQSGVISVALEDSDPARAAAVLNEIVNQYLLQNELRRSEGAEKQLSFLERQLPDLKQALEQSEAEYNRARNKWGSIDLGEEGKGLLQIAVLGQSKLIELQQRRAELTAKYEPAHPAVQAVDDQIRAISQQYNQVNQKIKRLPQVEQEILRLRRDVTVNTEVYTNVMNAAQQLRLASASRVGNVRLLDKAEIPVDAVKPRRAAIVVAAGTLGTLLALFVVLVRKGIGRRVYSPEEVEQTLGIPVSAVILRSRIPQSDPGARRDRQAAGKPLPENLPMDATTEAFRRLQTCLLNPLEEPDRSTDDAFEIYRPSESRVSTTVIAVVGATAGVGKSFVSCNLAAVLSSSQKRVLLIDADLRTGQLHRRFGVEREPGLVEAILAESPLKDTIRASVLPNLDLVSTGKLPRNPAAVLSHSGLGHFLKSMGERYDVVIVDTAPILPVADTLLIVPYADLLLNVVCSEMTTMDEIEEVDKQLRRAGAKAAAVVYNKMRTRHGRYGYYAAYA